ncbi:ribonuclease H-like domain-containing protein [Exophiala viscosa]|uniref:ribonuclease H-like domain-containing protein n=1 Tax=Exophiala viscosa TaxID=2486360 RepID=UPI0021987EEF|nr:ribonuclease H-like domain-containing protein [Exophiala viscosa]
MDLLNLSSNWKKLQSTLPKPKPNPSSAKTAAQNGLKRKRGQSLGTSNRPSQGSLPRKRVRKGMSQNSTVSTKTGSIRDLEASDAGVRPRPADRAVSDQVNAGLCTSVEVGRYVAVDCEMVGVGPHPDRESALARVSIVNYNGDQIYDSYVLPQEDVTDWRTHVSGVEPKHMKYARSFQEVQADVSNIIKDRILIGHHIRHDLDALMISHPQRDIRDTARHHPYRKTTGGGYPRLKILASELLGFEIQEGEHSSIEDARACMLLFRKDKTAFEREHSKRWAKQVTTAPREDRNAEGQDRKPTKKKKPKKKK